MLQKTIYKEAITDVNGQEQALLATTPEVRPLGYSLQSVEVPELGESLPDYAEHHEAFRQLDQLLIDNPDWQGPKVTDDRSTIILDGNNEVTTTLYALPGASAMRRWLRDLVPSALALETLALANDNKLPTLDVDIDQNSMDIFLYTADARSIRSRGTLMAELLVEHMADKNPDNQQRWVSLACGAARPVLEAAARVKENGDGTPIDVTLIDFDQKVLDYSGELADKIGSVESHTEKKADLIRTMIARDTLVAELGEESMDVVDVLGFLEYCRDKQAVDMLRNSYRLVAPGGVLVTANMREDRPEKELHLRGVGWPGVTMRSSDALVELAVAAGIDPSDIEAYQPTDGVYTVMKISKPSTN